MNDTQRLDKWLWCARFCKTRAVATALIEAGRVRVNGERVHKAHYAVRQGLMLTFPQGQRIRVVRVIGMAERRVSAPDAAGLFEDLSPIGVEQKPGGG